MFVSALNAYRYEYYVKYYYVIYTIKITKKKKENFWRKKPKFFGFFFPKRFEKSGFFLILHLGNKLRIAHSL